MSRTSLSDLRRRVEYINDRTGLKLRINRWSPGDGYSRYSLVDDTGENLMSNPTSYGHTYYRLHELDALLAGILTGFDLNTR